MQIRLQHTYYLYLTFPHLDAWALIMWWLTVAFCPPPQPLPLTLAREEPITPCKVSCHDADAAKPRVGGSKAAFGARGRR